jgi:predicted ATPase
VEELTKAVIEAGSDPTAPRTIPATLQASLMARLDRLGAVKEVAQTAAVIGREFSYRLLHAVSPLPEAGLQAALRALADAELVYPRGLPPEATYLFKHTLVQETAYDSLLRARRRELHAKVARVLTEQFAQTVETQPELLAHHWTEAGEADQAVTAWTRAG